MINTILRKLSNLKKKVGFLFLMTIWEVTRKLKCNFFTTSHKQLVTLNICSILIQIQTCKYLWIFAGVDEICDKGAEKASSCGGGEGCLELLLRERYSPDASKYLTFGCRSHARVCGFSKRVSLPLTPCILKLFITVLSFIYWFTYLCLMCRVFLPFFSYTFSNWMMCSVRGHLLELQPCWNLLWEAQLFEEESCRT